MSRLRPFALALGFIMLSCLAACTHHLSNSSKTATKTVAADRSDTDDLNNVYQLWVSDPETVTDSDAVMILLQGGPREYLYFVKDGRTLSRYLPQYNSHHVVYLHQSQTLNPDLFATGFDFDMADARREKAKTTEILDKAIRHFKGKGKTVTVIGHSYGAFIVTDYLANYDPKANTYIVSAGRLDVSPEMVADNMRGVSSHYAEDGLTYVDYEPRDFSDYTALERGAYHVRALLKAAYGEPRYSKVLNNTNLSNVYFVSGKGDQQVGALTQNEIDTLRARGATVLMVEGGHYDVYKRMIDAAMDGTIAYGAENSD